ncbi:MAG: hypothetical protein HC923_06855, partial [Myxococcales bacterium]|nr:hypothetical protein [Myxococcales bacterium]
MMDPILQATRDADVRLSLDVATTHPGLHEAAAKGGSYLPAATLVIRNLIGSGRPIATRAICRPRRRRCSKGWRCRSVQFGLLAAAAEPPVAAV